MAPDVNPQANRKNRSPKKQRDWGAIKLYGISSLVGVAIIAGAVLSKQSADNWVKAVKVYEYTGGVHVAEKIDYKESPAVGGKHFSAWQNCGFYSEPIQQELAVHSLEHGAVWLTYRADLDPAKISQLAGYTGRSPYVLISPVVGQTEEVIATAWNRQLAMDSADDPRIAQFVEMFVSGPQTPELGAACWGGVGNPV